MISSDIGLISTEKILNKIKEKFDKQLFNKESFLKILRDENDKYSKTVRKVTT